MSERKYAPVHEVIMYQARCTNCGTTVEEYGDYSAWSDPDTPRNDVVENWEWFERFTDGELIELLCPNCQKCEVCGSDNAHNVNGDDRLVCGDHEDHDFSAVAS